MNPEQILEQMSVRGRMPVEAIRAAGADRAAVLPFFLQAIEQCRRGETAPSTKAAMLVVFHLLGEWRETRAYRPLAMLLRRPSDDLELLLGDAITETSVKVMAAVFDGDPTPLYDVIRDADADEFARSSMCEALATVTLRGALAREDVARFLLACYSDLKPQGECFVWVGWQTAIAMLGLVELRSAVEKVFRRGYISPTWMELRHFKEDLAQTVRDPQSWLAERRYSVPGDAVEELLRWCAFREDDREPIDDPWRDDRSTDWSPSPWPVAPLVNPFKGVGRNDPCPCGSRQKFKKCCLSLTQDAYADV
jgi:hypothetical protein